MRVTSRSSRPRAKTRRRCAAPATGRRAVGTTPGLTVRMAHSPSGPVAHRPKPRKPSRRRAARIVGVVEAPVGVGLPRLDQRVRHGCARAVDDPAAQTTPRPACPRRTTSGPSSHARAMCRNGPTVCDGVSGRRVMSSSARAPRTASRPSRAARCRTRSRAPTPAAVVAEVEPAHQSLPRGRVRDGVEDRVVGEERVVREVHLGDQPLGERPAEQREMDVRRPPGVVVVAPRVGARLDGREPVAALGCRSAPGPDR